MATLADKLTLQVAAVTYKDMLEMVESEKRMRKDLLDGVSQILITLIGLYSGDPNIEHVRYSCNGIEMRTGPLAFLSLSSVDVVEKAQDSPDVNKNAES